MIFQRRLISVTSLAGLLFMAPTGTFLHAQETHFRSQFWRSKAKVIIPFEYFRNQIVVKLSLNNGLPANFLVDTGSDHTLLSQRAVETAHLKTNAVKGEVNSLAGRCHLNLTVGGVRIGAGKNELVHGSMPVIDLTAWETELGIPLESIIGFDYIRQFPTFVGYSAKTITIFADKKVQYQGNGERVVVERREKPGDSPDLPVIVANLKLPDGSFASARLTIDTGSDGGLSLHGPFVRLHAAVQVRTKADLSAQPILSAAFCGEYEQQLGKVAAIQLGELRFSDPGTVYAADPVGISAGDETDGELGNKFLSQFRIFFDIPRNLIVLEPN